MSTTLAPFPWDYIAPPTHKLAAGSRRCANLACSAGVGVKSKRDYCSMCARDMDRLAIRTHRSIHSLPR